MSVRTALSPARWTRLFSLASVEGLAFTLLGPFGSYSANPFTRLIYWSMLFWSGTLILVPFVLAAMVYGEKRGFPHVFAGAIATMIASAPLAWLAARGCKMFWPVHASVIQPQEWYALTISVALSCVGFWLWLEQQVGWDLSPASSPGSHGQLSTAVMPLRWEGPAADPSSGIPEPLLALAYCLEMEDHHVRVHLPHGSTLHLASMRDAVAAMGRGRGLQVHRSWWVARQALRGWEQDGRSVVLILDRDLRVPVARQRIAMLRAEGWLD